MQDNPPGVMEGRVSDAAATGKPVKKRHCGARNIKMGSHADI